MKIDSKKRRTKRQIEEAKLNELDQENILRSKNANIDQLEAQIA